MHLGLPIRQMRPIIVIPFYFKERMLGIHVIYAN